MRYEHPAARLLYPAYRRIFDSLRRSRSLSRRLFGINFPSDSPYFFWDHVTLGMRKVLMGETLEGLAVCDMGCGPVAALSALAARRGCTDLTAVDIVPELAESARAVLTRNDIGAEVITSDFDQALGERTFDLILFNSAYVPTGWGEEQGINREYPIESAATSVTWSGGADGTDSIRGFVTRMPRLLRPEGRMLLGFNRFYVEKELVRAVCQEAGVTVARERAWRALPAVVMEVRPMIDVTKSGAPDAAPGPAPETNSVAVLFSGGSDSTLAAVIAARQAATVHLVTYAHPFMLFHAKIDINIAACVRSSLTRTSRSTERISRGRTGGSTGAACSASWPGAGPCSCRTYAARASWRCTTPLSATAGATASRGSTAGPMRSPRTCSPRRWSRS